MTSIDLDPADLDNLDGEVAVRALMVAYMRACDEHDADAVAVLFDEAAVWETPGDPSSVLNGRQEVRAAYAVACARLTFCMHFLTNEWIRVDGDRAWARWCYFEPAINRGELAVWTAGRYDHELVKKGGQWLFSRFRLTAVLAATQADGWGTVPKVPLP
jgi:uncharacterized protein (TIGR02246 family)